MLGLFGIIGLATYYSNADSTSKSAKTYAIIAALYILVVAFVSALIKYNAPGIAIERAAIDCVAAFFVAWLYFFCIDKAAPWPWLEWIVIIFGAAVFFLLV